MKISVSFKKIGPRSARAVNGRTVRRNRRSNSQKSAASVNRGSRFLRRAFPRVG